MNVLVLGSECNTLLSALRICLIEQGHAIFQYNGPQIQVVMATPSSMEDDEIEWHLSQGRPIFILTTDERLSHQLCTTLENVWLFSLSPNTQKLKTRIDQAFRGLN